MPASAYRLQYEDPSMKPKPRWMRSVIAAAKEAGGTPLFLGHRKREAIASAQPKPVRG